MPTKLVIFCLQTEDKDVTHLDVFEGDDPLGRVLRGVLEVVEATVVEDEPPPLPVLPPAIGQHSTKQTMHSLIKRAYEIPH